MVEETIGNTGTVPREVSADAGYYSARAVAELCALGIDPLIAPDKTRHGTIAATGAPGPHTQQPVSQGPDAPQVADETWAAAIRPAHGDSGAGVRPDQARGGDSASSCCGAWRR